LDGAFTPAQPEIASKQENAIGKVSLVMASVHNNGVVENQRNVPPNFRAGWIFVVLVVNALLGSIGSTAANLCSGTTQTPESPLG
jgi:hypothetical protein